jgi:hypothetical protein
MPNLPRKCPACNADLAITRLSCPDCGTEVTGSFQPDVFSRLSPNDFDFVVLFLKSKGNIKEMERELGISYWTIRSKLGEIVERLGLEPGAAAEGTPPAAPAEGTFEGESDLPKERRPSREPGLSNRRQEILDQLNAGQLSVQEAAILLEQIKRKTKERRFPHE